MADDPSTIELSRSELREVAGYAVACARPALAIFERERPDGSCGWRPRPSCVATMPTPGEVVARVVEAWRTG